MTALRSILLVARRELVERGRSTYFLGSTLLMLVIVVGAILGPALLGGDGSYTLGVTGDTPSPLLEALRGGSEADLEIMTFDDAVAAETALAAETVDAVLIRSGSGGYELVWRSDPDALLSAVVTGAVAGVEVTERADRLGIDAEAAETLLAPSSLVQRSVEERDPQQEGRQFLAWIMLILLFMAIVTYGTFVLTGVVEEKTSRVVEVLLARIAPRHLLAGKVTGIGLLALGQLLVLGVAVVLALRLGPDLPGPVPTIRPDTMVWLVVWFVLGYAFYSMAYGAIGALAARMEDAQTASAPLNFIVVAVYFFVFTVVVENPEALAGRIASFVPVTAPMVMPLRLAAGNASALESLAAIALMLISVYGLVRLAGRVYTGAILRTGRRVKLREAWSTR